MKTLGDIGYRQKELLFKVGKFIKKIESNDKNFSSNKKFYLNCWAGDLGNLKFKSLFEKKIFSFDFILLFIKEFVYKFQYSNCTVLNNIPTKKKFKKIIISWCNKKDIKREEFFDRYFQFSSKKNKNILWITQSLENITSLSKKIDNVIIINPVQNSKIEIIVNILNYFSKKIFFFFKKEFSSNEFSIDSFVCKKVIDNVNYYSIKKIILVYEAQTLQNLICKSIKESKKNIKVFGYLHSMLPSLPAEFYFKKYSHPDKFLVHGNGQKKILTKYLNWPSSKIKVVSSRRFKKNSKKKFNGKVLLPYNISGINNLLENFDNFFKKFDDYSLPKFKIINHPSMKNSKIHIEFIKKLKNILNLNKKKMSTASKRKNISVVFSVTGTILEALENDVDVFQLCSYPIYESHSPIIWNNLKVNMIDQSIFYYRLSKKQTYIKFRKNFHKVDKWCK